MLRRRRSESETLRLGEKFLKNLGKRKIGLKVESLPNGRRILAYWKRKRNLRKSDSR